MSDVLGHNVTVVDELAGAAEELNEKVTLLFSMVISFAHSCFRD